MVEVSEKFIKSVIGREVLIPVAKGQDKRSRLWALRTLRSIRSKEALATVREVCAKDLDSEDRLVRRSAAYALSEVADESILPALVAALAKHADRQVRWRAGPYR